MTRSDLILGQSLNHHLFFKNKLLHFLKRNTLCNCSRYYLTITNYERSFYYVNRVSSTYPTTYAVFMIYGLADFTGSCEFQILTSYCVSIKMLCSVKNYLLCLLNSIRARLPNSSRSSGVKFLNSDISTLRPPSFSKYLRIVTTLLFKSIAISNLVFIGA